MTPSDRRFAKHCALFVLGVVVVWMLSVIASWAGPIRYVDVLSVLILLWWSGIPLVGLLYWLGVWRGLLSSALSVLVGGVIGSAVIITLYSNVRDRARLAADMDMLAAMRSAVAIYYGQHNQTFPGHPGNYVSPSPPVFRCAKLTYVYSPATGDIRITSTNSVADCP